ncbi:protoporphyrinogen oxidase [Solibacillus sp. MA9]|uniref:Protoporphyrinogen oxidase n=1 Tax=Solibacillus palustris TaxID=2908203 RepID=A0ABS9UCE8_9BACL|nr:protoporphyrinogen oxidase [Solibacillus sp. MA9]MCH7322012.1 protoporphyrinogen oxidase [Solibacillus sp. MA9]
MVKLHLEVLERCSKETEDTITAEGLAFAATPISYLKENQGEFIYVECTQFIDIRIDAVALEFDDAFNLYTALFGLKLQKKHGEAIRKYLKANVKSVLGSSSAAFSGQEGLWELNIAVDCIEGFNDSMSIEEVCEFLYHFVAQLLTTVDV